ncbi:hypothetical protein M3Y96_00956400 [Aphelenchoides besseyi]|nr:hypothetical protein M3Y96_00956400 [Aphelenchoides besseyi]
MWRYRDKQRTVRSVRFDWSFHIENRLSYRAFLFILTSLLKTPQIDDHVVAMTFSSNPSSTKSTRKKRRFSGPEVVVDEIAELKSQLANNNSAKDEIKESSVTVTQIDYYNFNQPNLSSHIQVDG